VPPLKSRRIPDGPETRTKRAGAIGLTGTPGTGKKSVSPILARLLGMEDVRLNSMAEGYSERSGDGDLLVDVKLLARRVAQRGTAGAVFSGHLLSDVLPPSRADFIAVLRCEPSTLKRRLSARGYSPQKVLENVEAELIGVVLDGAIRRYGAPKVHEYDSTRTTASALARRIATDYRAGRAQTRPWVDWTLRYGSSTRLMSLLSSPRTDPAST
jgi:adenylate kinase